MDRKFCLGPLLALLCAAAMYAQANRAVEWWTFGANAQRDGWAKDEHKIPKDEIRNFHLLWERTLDNSKPRTGATLGPIVSNEAVIEVRHDSSVWALRQDQMLWTKSFAPPGKKHRSKPCAGNLTAMPVLSEPAKPESGSVAPFASSRSLYIVAGDGMLRQLNPADGSNQNDPLPFVPRGAPVLALNAGMSGIYAATRSACDQDGAVWSFDFGEQKVRTLKLHADVAGLGGVAIGKGGNIFVETREGAFDPPGGKWGGALLNLSRDLQLRDYFVMPGTEAKNGDTGMNLTTPTIITLNGEEMVVTANRDGRIYVLKTPALGGNDHHQYFVRSSPLSMLDRDKMHGIWGGLASWEDYIFVPVWGPPNSSIFSTLPKANAPHGSIVALKFSEYRGVTSLTPVWISADMETPGVPVIAGDMLFVLSNGQFWKKHGHATLLALDAATGETLYSSQREVTKAGNLTGLSVADGRVYFNTVNHTVYAFGR